MAERSQINDHAAFLAGQKLGMDQAIKMMRGGWLRLAPLPFERGERPYDDKLRPVRATLLIWRSWWRERRGN